MSDAKHILSQGLDVLFQAENTSAPKMITGVSALPLAVIDPGTYQPRQHFDETALQELADSIKAQGLIQPIIVRAKGEGRYEIIAGERRFRASKLAGLTEIAVIQRNVDDTVVAAFALIENIQREDLNPLEEAKAFQRLIDHFQLTHQEVSDRVGRSRPSISNALRLLDLSEAAKAALSVGQLEMGHARALLSLSEIEQQIAIAKIVERGLTVRETEALVQQVKSPHKPANFTLTAEGKAILASWQQRLAKYVNAVKVKMTARDNITLTLRCESLEEADDFINDIETLKDKYNDRGSV